MTDEREGLDVFEALDRLTGFAYGRARSEKAEDRVSHWSDVIRAALETLRADAAERIEVSLFEEALVQLRAGYSATVYAYPSAPRVPCSLLVHRAGLENPK